MQWVSTHYMPMRKHKHAQRIERYRAAHYSMYAPLVVVGGVHVGPVLAQLAHHLDVALGGCPAHGRRVRERAEVRHRGHDVLRGGDGRRR